jgi:pimeloyl-ACP methyl ester carboxylesterase
MGTLLKWIGRIAIALVVLCGTAAAFLLTPEVPRAELVARYGGAPSQFVTLMSGSTAHYRDRGPRDAPVLLLLHGSNASLHTWEPWAALLSDRLRIVSVDLPGHGLTGAVPRADYSQGAMASFVLEFASAIGLGRFAIAGNSMGGGVAARFTIDNPERVTALILIDAAGLRSKSAGDPGFGFRIARMPILRDALRFFAQRAIFEDGLKAAFADDTLVTPDMVERYWLLNRMEGTPAATIARFGTPPDTTLQEKAGTIAIPTLILWGDQDRLIPIDAAELWHQAVKGSTVIVYPGVGHIPMEEAADTSAADVAAFLSRLSPG